ncbi:MAG: hypothetical protein U5L11_05620 [Arhodomonas sp.]|nr:hypothetical protein [Arhodomonas sp.]
MTTAAASGGSWASTTTWSSPTRASSLAEGAIRPWQMPGSQRSASVDLMRYAHRRGVPTDVALAGPRPRSDQHVGARGRRRHGAAARWYGVQRYFDWLESKSYKMHVRVLLSRYRSYDLCPRCHGARLKPEALAWRLGDRETADAVLAPEQRFRPEGARLPAERLATCPASTSMT